MMDALVWILVLFSWALLVAVIAIPVYLILAVVRSLVDYLDESNR